MADLVPYNPSGIIAGPNFQGQRPSSGFEGYSESEPEVRGLKEYLAIVRRHLWIVFLTTALFAGLAAWLVFTAPRNTYPAFPSLEWHYAATNTWVGRLPKQERRK